MNLQTELHDLTAGPPAQPADRLLAVAGKARRLRRTRAALSIAAVLAIAAPVGLALQPQTTTQTSYAGSTTWPDRSQQADRPVAEGAVQQRHLFDSEAPVGDVRWLYRGTVQVPDGSTAYVAIWREAGQLVTAYTDLREVGDDGVPDGGFSEGSESPFTPWRIFSAKEDASPAVGVYLPYDQGLSGGKGAVLVLTDPGVTTLRWGVEPLANAPTEGGRLDSGELSGSDGVFTGDTGATVGPLTVTTLDSSKALVAQRLAIPNQSLMRPTLTGLPDNFNLLQGGSGEFDNNPDNGRSVGYASDPTTKAALFARCYGAGSITFLLGDRNQVVGRAACDGNLHEVFRDRTLAGSDNLYLTGTGRQAWRFELGTVQQP